MERIKGEEEAQKWWWFVIPGCDSWSELSFCIPSPLPFPQICTHSSIDWRILSIAGLGKLGPKQSHVKQWVGCSCCVKWFIACGNKGHPSGSIIIPCRQPTLTNHPFSTTLNQLFFASSPTLNQSISHSHEEEVGSSFLSNSPVDWSEIFAYRRFHLRVSFIFMTFILLILGQNPISRKE